ncbi:MAG: hypothetical protein AB7V42_02320 [Thermoleophilia bacterium]
MDAPRRSPLSRLLVDDEGDVRTTRLVGFGVLAAVILGVGMFAALLAAGAGSPGTLAVWLIAAFILVKLPFLALIWWLISRRADPEGGGGWSQRECGEILRYLETQAGEAVGRPDAAKRLAYFSREAWFVADGATDRDKAAAVATAIRIEGLATRAGARPARLGA